MLHESVAYCLNNHGLQALHNGLDPMEGGKIDKNVITM
jgi:hypothetical protein